MIPGAVISALTFPGVIVHEWAHKFFCERLGVLVHEVKYFQFGNLAGYVVHELPKTYKQTFWISIGPLLVNSFAAVGLSFVASQTVSEGWLWYLLLWLAISVGMHSFPSDHDMQHVSEASKAAIKEGGSFLHYLAFPFVMLVSFANLLRFFWFDAIYAFILISIGGGFASITGNASTSAVQYNTDGTVVVGKYNCPTSASTYADTIEPDENEKNKITEEESSLLIRNNEIESLSKSIDNDSVDENDQSEIDRHNKMVERYNNLLIAYKADVGVYDTEINLFNKKVDDYNQYLQQNCTPK